MNLKMPIESLKLDFKISHINEVKYAHLRRNSWVTTREWRQQAEAQRKGPGLDELSRRAGFEVKKKILIRQIADLQLSNLQAGHHQDKHAQADQAWNGYPGRYRLDDHGEQR